SAARTRATPVAARPAGGPGHEPGAPGPGSCSPPHRTWPPGCSPPVAAAHLPGERLRRLALPRCGGGHRPGRPRAAAAPAGGDRRLVAVEQAVQGDRAGTEYARIAPDLGALDPYLVPQYPADLRAARVLEPVEHV